MPWQERSGLEERKEFIGEWLRQEESFAEICRQYGISRQTGYKWCGRWETGGAAGLEERSRAPLKNPRAMSERVRESLLELRQAHPRWGARKLREMLGQRCPQERRPAASSIAGLLRREGLVQPRKLRRRTPGYSEPLAHAEAPNQVWSGDYKGWFLCGNGERCDPLTVSDACSRYLLRCQAVARTDEAHARAVLEGLFREVGLPEAIRTDNGPPFASPAPGGLSRLSMWWVRLGIRPERIEAGHPEQNGRHERLHLTLKQETASPPEANLRRQQEAFLRFQREYNQERPHQALEYRTPASVYVPSPRPYPSRLAELEYGPQFQLRRISSNGYFSWKHQAVFVSGVLRGEVMGFLETDDGLFEVYYGPLLLGWFDAVELAFVADRGWRR
jgi:transposase InsO family protein